MPSQGIAPPTLMTKHGYDGTVVRTLERQQRERKKTHRPSLWWEHVPRASTKRAMGKQTSLIADNIYFVLIATTHIAFRSSSQPAPPCRSSKRSTGSPDSPVTPRPGVRQYIAAC